MRAEWTTEQKVDYLLRHVPWTIAAETTPEGDTVLRCREIPDATGSGATDAEIEADFWESLRASLEAFLHFNQRPAVPASVQLPWETKGRPSAAVRLVMTTTAKAVEIKMAPKRTATIGFVNEKKESPVVTA